MGRNDEAAAAFLSIEPGERYLAAQARYTRLLAKQGQLEKALQHLDTLPISSNEQKIGVLQLKVQTLRDAKQFERAMTLLDDALKQYPGNPDLLYDRAMVAERLNRIAESERDLREILRLKPDDPMALNALGHVGGFGHQLDHVVAAGHAVVHGAPFSAEVDEVGRVRVGFKQGNFRLDACNGPLVGVVGVKPRPRT